MSSLDLHPAKGPRAGGRLWLVIVCLATGASAVHLVDEHPVRGIEAHVQQAALAALLDDSTTTQTMAAPAPR